MNLSLLAPEIAVAATAATVVLLDLFTRRKGWLTCVSLAGIAAAAALTIPLAGRESQPIWNGLLALDGLAVFFKLFVLGLVFMVILASIDYMRNLSRFHGEYHALILLAGLGMMLLVSAIDIMAVFVALELVAISFYALTGLLKTDRSSEAALKYMLLGGINSAILLYGLALVFGFTGHTGLADISSSLQELPAGSLADSPGLILGLVLILAGFGFKTAAVPFHMWAPDVYEGSPTPVTLYLSTASKLAGVAVLLRVLLTAFLQPSGLSHDWGVIIAAISAAGMTLGNLLAVPQVNIKRLLAYSGIAQTGYMLIAIASLGYAAAASSATQTGLLFYAGAFALAELAAFSAVIAVSQTIKSDLIQDYTGLGQRAPLIAIALSVGLLSLMGLPLTAGFIAKYYIFSQAASSGLLWLVVIGVINTVISAYYYLNVLRVMWMGKAANDTPVGLSAGPKLVMALSVLAVLAAGVLPVWGIKLAEFGTRLLLP